MAAAMIMGTAMGLPAWSLEAGPGVTRPTSPHLVVA